MTLAGPPREGPGKTLDAAVRAGCRALLLLALAAGTQRAASQTLVYVEPGNAACPAVPAPASATSAASGSSAATAKTVPRGASVPGSLRVTCGFEQGSYTVTLSSTDPSATFSPKTFLVNFGRIVGSGRFAVTFSTPGVQSVSATITSNMGSPAVQGHFATAAPGFKVVHP